VKARRRIGPQATTAPDFAATRLEPPRKRRLHPTPRDEGNLGATARGSLDPGSCSRLALDCNGRKVTRSASFAPDQRLLGHSKPPSLARRWQRVTWRTNRSRLVLLGAARDKKGQKQVPRPFPRPKTPRVRVRCPEGPSIKGPHRIGQSMFPGRPGSRVNQPKPWLRRQTQPGPTKVGIERSAGCSCSWSVADVDKTHLPPGARPAERQAANHGVTSCGGLLGDDEGPIRSGQKGAGLARANRLVSAQEPALTARWGIKSTEGVLVRIASSP